VLAINNTQQTYNHSVGANDNERFESPVDDVTDDTLSREVYSILGTPIDVIDLPSVLRRIEAAASASSPFFLSTPNLNFLVQALADSDFRESLLQSDLCPPDGMPIVWLGRLLGIPIRTRVAGADILTALKFVGKSEHNLKLFFFGGAYGIASAAARAFNASSSGSRCVGWLYPGFCSVEELSKDTIIETINSSGAEFLVVSLGAKKAQSWLVRNADKLRIPIRAHLGAWVNFEAGALKRAPVTMRNLGLEWLWRIKEEPTLWKRYWHDGLILLQLLCLRVLPLVIYRITTQSKAKSPFSIDIMGLDEEEFRVKIWGAATRHNIKEIILRCSVAASARRQVVIDLSDTCAIDARFLGFLLMLRNSVGRHGAKVRLVGLSRSVQRQFRLNGVGFLLQSEASVTRVEQDRRGRESGGTIPEKIVSEALGRLG
jgi:N-acetylglucosaminyldiphosphoundecaprenol N-acetyl-beta-D-mannosaminyltransferase